MSLIPLGILAASKGVSGSFESIASSTPASGATSVVFSSIPQTYQSLQVRFMARRNAAGSLTVYVRPNADTTGNKAYHYLSGTGSSVTATGTTSNSRIWITDGPGSTNTANTFTTGIIDIHNYTNTSQNKTIRAFAGWDANGSGTVYLSSGLWLSTSAITSLEIEFGTDAIVSGSTFALYGIKGA